MKIAVIGYSGSGKSTLTKALAKIYRCPLLYLDTVQFTQNWQERDKAQAKALVWDFMQKNDSWVIDGNYKGFYQKERLEQAQQIVFFDFPRRTCLRQALKRWLQHKNTVRESSADGCIEKMDFEFLLWILWKGRAKKYIENYNAIKTTYAQKTVILKNNKQVKAFLKQAEEALKTNP